MNTKDESTDRTIQIFKKGGRILIKRSDGWYLGAWTSIEAGPDWACWSKKKEALSFFNLKWAHHIAKLYGGKVVVSYPKKVEETFTLTRQEAESIQHLLWTSVGNDALTELNLSRVMYNFPMPENPPKLKGRVNLFTASTFVPG